MPRMGSVCSLVAALAVSFAAGAHAQSPYFANDLAEARAARDAGLRDDVAYDLLRSLTTEVGPRLAGSPGDARAVSWAQANLRRLGFSNVRAESCAVPRWVRGEARVEITAPHPQPLACVSLGGSVGTPAEGLLADVVAARSLDELKALGIERVRGRIVFFHGRMQRTPDLSGYRNAVAVRSRGAAEAAKLGAVGVVIRSIGTSDDRLPHTGGMRYDSTGTRIPALALSNPDADLLERQVASGQTVRLRLWSSARADGEARSANVVGELPGRDPNAGLVLLAAHLDSWDLGQGAHDDGAGVAIVVAAARLAARTRPERTIRVVLFANEEFGLSGARAYAAAHLAELPRHVVAIESDLGAFPAWGFESAVPPDELATVRAIAAMLESDGVAWQGNQAAGGPDLGPLRARGVPVLELLTDARPYFDLHHTANDTFDKIDPVHLRSNVALYAAITSLAARASARFGRLPEAP